MAANRILFICFLGALFGISFEFQCLVGKQSPPRGFGRFTMNKKRDGDDFSNKLLPEKLNRDLPSFVKALRTRASQVSELSYNERADLKILLNNHVTPDMKHQYYVSLVTSISNLKSNSKNWDVSADAKAIFRTIPCAKDMSYEDISVVLVSFAKIQASFYKDLSTKSDFMSKLACSLPLMKEKTVGDIIWSLGTMDARWSTLSPELQKAIVDSVNIHGASFNAYSLSSVIWALAKMGAKKNILRDDVLVGLISKLNNYSFTMSPQQSSKTVWAIGSLGISYDALPESLLETCLENVSKIKKSQMSGAIPAGQILVGLAKTGLPWTKMSTSMKGNTWEQLTRVCQTSNDRSIPNAVWSMATLGCPFSEFPKSVREAMMEGSVHISGTCSAWAFSNMIWAFAKMGLSWDELPQSWKESVISNAGRLELDMNNLDVSIILWSLGSLDAPFDALPERMINPLLNVVSRSLTVMKPQEISSLIWGLSGTSMSWDMLPVSLRWSLNVALRRVADDMSPQDVANCAYGLALISFDTQNPSDPGFRGAHEALLSKTLSATKSFKSSNIELEQLRIFAHFYDIMKIGAGRDVVPPQFFDVDYESLHSREFKGSNLQDKVTQSVRSALESIAMSKDIEVEIASEQSSFNGILPVDAIVTMTQRYNPRKKRVLAILEIDGPQHYRVDGSLRRKDLLKESMYLKRHPGALFFRVRWDEVNKIGFDRIGSSLAVKIVEKIQKSQENPVTSFFKSLLS